MHYESCQLTEKHGQIDLLTVINAMTSRPVVAPVAPIVPLPPFIANAAMRSTAYRISGGTAAAAPAPAPFEREKCVGCRMMRRKDQMAPRRVRKPDGTFRPNRVRRCPGCGED